eukprot:scaffold207_cov409-Prasinococcus_capsulatus_cf.AAC.83
MRFPAKRRVHPDKPRLRVGFRVRRGRRSAACHARSSPRLNPSLPPLASRSRRRWAERDDERERGAGCRQA